MTVKDLLQKTETDVESLSDMLGSRVRRSWYNTIKESVKIIHGLLNGDEMVNYERIINTSLESNHEEMRKFQGKINILENQIKYEANEFQDLWKNISALRSEVIRLSQEEKNNRHILDKLKISQYLQATASYGLKVYQEIQTVITALMFGRKNTIHPKIASPKRILSELIKADKYLPEHLHFPYALLEQNTEGILNIADIKVFKIRKLLVFVIRNPLTIDEVYDLYKLIPYPVKFSDNQSVYVNPREPYLLINEYRTLFSLIPNINTCKSIHPEQFLCELEKPLFSRLKSRACETELLIEPKIVPQICDLRIVHLESEIWEKIHFFNTWIYTVPSLTVLKINCPTKNDEVSIVNSGVLTLSSGCWASTQGIQLYANPVEFQEEYHSVLPKINLSEAIAKFRVEIKNYLDNHVTPPTGVHNFQDLNSEGISIKFILDNQDPIITNCQVIIIFVVSSVIIIIGICQYVLIKIKKLKRLANENREEELPNYHRERRNRARGFKNLQLEPIRREEISLELSIP